MLFLGTNITTVAFNISNKTPLRVDWKYIVDNVTFFFWMSQSVFECLSVSQSGKRNVVLRGRQLNVWFFRSGTSAPRNFFLLTWVAEWLTDPPPDCFMTSGSGFTTRTGHVCRPPVRPPPVGWEVCVPRTGCAHPPSHPACSHRRHYPTIEG